jgi:hypothetical protein
MGEGGSVDERTAAEVAVSMRRLLASIEAGELSCSAAQRHRLQGAVVTLEALASSPENGRIGDDAGEPGDSERDQG